MNRTAATTAVAAGLCLSLTGCLEGAPTLELPGYVEADITAVATPVAGTLQQMQVKEGQLVKPGDLLYVLESAQEEAKLAEAQAVKAQAAAQSRNLSKGARAAEIEQLRAKVRYAEAQLEQARTQLRRTEQLRNNGFVSDIQSLQERTQVQLAQAQVEDANAALRTAQQAAREDERAAADAGVDAAALHAHVTAHQHPFAGTGMLILPAGFSMPAPAIFRKIATA